MKQFFFLTVLSFLIPLTAFSQQDSTVVRQIIEEGLNRSQVMTIASYLTDVHGPRLTNSPGYQKAAEWAINELKSWGLSDPRQESFGFFGKGWTLKRFYLNALQPVSYPVIGIPKGWSPGINGPKTTDIVFLDANSVEDLQAYKGRLKDKLVLISQPEQFEASFSPDARRHSDSTLLVLANVDPDLPRSRSRRSGTSPSLTMKEIFTFLSQEKVLATIEPSRGDDGTVFVMGAYVLQPDNLSWDQRKGAYHPEVKDVIPQIVVAGEQYNRWIRQIKKGQKIQAEILLEVEFTKPSDGYNVIAEIPGTDPEAGVVMLGGHLDSWHGGTGATDNASGVSVAMEAVRILKAVGAKPKRTIRIALWGGEEQGLLGSRGYVKKHLGERLDKVAPWDSISYKPDAGKFSVYFNMDNGTGKFRGLYMEGMESVRPLFRKWLRPFADKGTATLSPSATGGTDHMAFTAINLPGFQFIQDPIEYFQRTWHSNMDVYERLIEEDLKHNSIVMAAVVYQAAMADDRFPRKGQN